MDRNSILAIVLISLLIIGYMFYSSINYKEKEEIKKADSTVVKSDKDSSDDKLFDSPSETNSDTTNIAKNNNTTNTSKKELNYGAFQPFTIGNRQVITIETDKYIAKFSNKGADLISWQLKDYKKWDGVPTQLIKDRKGELFLEFPSNNGTDIDSRNLFYSFDTEKTKVELKGDEEFLLTATLEVAPGKSIIKKFKFSGNKYAFETGVAINNMDDYIPRGYLYRWTNGLAYQEKNSVDESSEAHALVQMNGDVENLNATDDKKRVSYTGKIDFVATKLKYFGAAIKPKDFDGTIDMSTKSIAYPKTKGMVEKYDLTIRVPYRGGQKSQEFLVYIGPLKLDYVESYGLNRMLNLGWWGIRHIGEYVMMPIFKAVHYFIPSWGITIIVFSIFIKLALYPLSITQMKNAQKMKILAPEVTKIREKYKDEPQVQQKQMMGLYSQYGVNPASGCLPMLLQMPILYSLWTLFKTNIDLRQSDFIWWIHDLSTPDTLVHFGTSILGISSISGLALAMGISMFIQQKLTISDPKQKAMVYVMPFMFTFLFSSFPAGLNLYYFMFNVLGIGQQLYINNFSKDKVTSIHDMKKVDKKKGWLAKKMEEAQAVAEAQGKLGTGGKKRKAQNPVNPNHRMSG
ncbi:membrane protein insertase YidC, partial [bacterium]